MCGIAGFAAVGINDPRASLTAMCDSMIHRGPDADGYYWDGMVGLGIRRLAIIDLGGGTQPAANEDGAIVVVFNGEIYNYRELRDGLIRRGHVLRSDSDTEVLPHLYEEMGCSVVHSLRGMFSFALWDSRKQRLLLARDRLGKKPLYYAPVNQGVAFGSELKVLGAGGFIRGEHETASIARYLALGYIPDPYSIYRGVLKLPPASVLVWRPGGKLSVERYWSPPQEEDRTIDEVTAVEEIRRLLSESVNCRLAADVPLGAFLSGGIDSAAVVAEMTQQLDHPVSTFSIGFEEERYNEAPAAAATAEALGTLHRSRILGEDASGWFGHLIDVFDEPFADSSSVPTYLVSQLAASHVKVVLSGDGGDEVFGGYTRYRDFTRRNVCLPSPIRRAIAELAGVIPVGTRGRNRLIELSRSPLGRYTGMVADPLATDMGGVASVATAGSLDWSQLLTDGLAGGVKAASLADMMYLDLLKYLPGDILTKVDRTSMAVSLEARAPLLDQHLVEFAARIPVTLKLREGCGKWIFRRAVRGLVPDAVFGRRKQGFSVPVGSWLRGPLRGNVEELFGVGSPVEAYVDTRQLSRIVREHLSGRRDHSTIIWKLLVLHAWFLHRRPVEAIRRPLDATARTMVIVPPLT
jgi:asparagine synthase (glutamine-hydrolysing)